MVINNYEYIIKNQRSGIFLPKDKLVIIYSK